MSFNGYMGTILHVDLGSGQTRHEALDTNIARAFLGSFGLNMKLAFDLIPPGVDPLSPENVIILGVGPLTGTLVPSSARISVTTKFPLGHTIGGGNGGVRMGAQVKLAGYDAIVISGKAAEPTYLLIQNDDIKLRPAKDLWGKDVFEATDLLWKKYPEAGILAIGQAGENLGNLALAMMDKVAATGRGGLGAVMGSKNLKALVVGGNQDVTIADRKRFMKIVNHYFKRIRNYSLYPEWIDLGLQRTWSSAVQRKGFHRPYGDTVTPTQIADKVCGIPVYYQFKKANFACFSCPLADKEIINIKQGGSNGLTTYASAFSGKLEPFVTLFNISDTQQAIECIDATNRYGLDNMDLIAVMDLAIDLFEKGVIKQEDTGGFVLKRNFDTAAKLIRWTALRKGLGEVMAQGSDALCKRFGLDPEHNSLTIKAWRPHFEPRITGMGTMEFEMVVNPRGAHHTSGGGPAYSPGSSTAKFATHANRMGAPDDAAERILNADAGFSAGRFTRYSEDWYSVLNSLGLCVRLQINRFHSIGSLAELYSSATGLETSPRMLAEAGERAWNMLRAWSAREGFSRKDDRFPAKWFDPLKTPDGEELHLRHYFGNPMGREDAEKMLDEYYDERGWDKTTGIPTLKKLTALGMGQVAEELKRYSIVLS